MGDHACNDDTAFIGFRMAGHWRVNGHDDAIKIVVAGLRSQLFKRAHAPERAFCLFQKFPVQLLPSQS